MESRFDTGSVVVRPLDGCVVIELGGRIAAGACGTLLAQLGADVVLIEPAAPSTEPKWRGRATVAAGKATVTIDRDLAADRELLRRLLAVADVVLLSTDLSDADRSLWEGERPARQVVCDLTAFGHTGPLAGQPATDPIVQAFAATAETTGRRHGPPALLGAPLLEMETAVYAASAIVAALRVVRQHGFGQRIDLAAYDVGVNALGAFLPLPFSGRIATRNGNRHPTLSPWNAYPARDGWVLICAPTGDQWTRLCAAMGVPELAEDPRFVSTTARMEHADDIDRAVGAWVAGQLAEECVASLGRYGIPSGPVVEIADLADEPNLDHRKAIRAAVDPVSGRTVLLPNCPVRWGSGADRTPIPLPDSGRATARALLTSRTPEPETTRGDLDTRLRPLSGVRVVEIGMNTVAPLAGRQLGALGADVIKVEPPRGDSNRSNAPLRADGQSYIFAISNTDKRGLVLDLRDDADRKTLWQVLATADVLIENLKPGSLQRLGFGPVDVRAQLPRLVYCSINGFGHDSAYPGRPALDTVVQAMSGVMSATIVDGVPTKAGISVSDQIGGLFGMLGVLAALEYRDRTGAGRTLDLAMHDGSAWMLHTVWNDVATQTGRIESTSDGHAVVDEGMRAPVLSADEVLAHPQTAARGLILDCPTLDGGSWPVLGSPLRLLSTPARVSTAMPGLGYVDPALAAEFGLAARHPVVPVESGV